MVETERTATTICSSPPPAVRNTSCALSLEVTNALPVQHHATSTTQSGECWHNKQQSPPSTAWLSLSTVTTEMDNGGGVVVLSRPTTTGTTTTNGDTDNVVMTTLSWDHPHHHHHSATATTAAAASGAGGVGAVTGGGSSIVGAVFNFTNSIVGAGAIGLGGAIAQSGGIIAIVTIIFFAILTKLSLDLVVRLSVEQQQLQQQQQGRGGEHGESHQSYEDLGYAGFGWWGKFAVMASKFMYAAGCLVAYIVVVRDNFGPAVRSLLYEHYYEAGHSHDLNVEATSTSVRSNCEWVLHEDMLLTWILSSTVIFPLCLLRDMTKLAGLSIISVISMVCIVGIVIYLYIVNPDDSIRHPSNGIYQDWFEVRPGYVECLGAFVFTFVSQHTVHLAYASLKPELRTIKNWEKVSSWSIGLSSIVSLTVGLGVYVSYWQATLSDIFQIYPSSTSIDLARLLLCITMLLTFPLPFFTCRELIVQFFWGNAASFHRAEGGNDGESDMASVTGDVEDVPQSPIRNELAEPLLASPESAASGRMGASSFLHRGETISMADLSILSMQAAQIAHSMLLSPDDDRQLVFPAHVILTGKLWFVTTAVAVVAPSLGDVLNLVGCASGTFIAFLLPACLSFKLKGYSHLAALLLLVGGTVGLVGTAFNLKQLVVDMAKTIKTI